MVVSCYISSGLLRHSSYGYSIEYLCIPESGSLLRSVADDEDDGYDRDDRTTDDDDDGCTMHSG